MEESILRRVHAKLNSKYYATNDSWLRDCVEYYLSEHNNPRDTEVLEFVISQWQLSDMREISNEKPCLPKNLDREKCTTLRGNFILQMEKVRDISESKYKQIEKIRNLSNANVEVTDLEKNQVDREPSKKRMLLLELTDGAQDVTGIEYKPVKFLNDALLPGYKLLIKGPVICRRSVMLLDETNIEEIGGEVASLLVPNALENVLARALNLPENPDPYKDEEDIKTDEDVLFNDDFDIDMEDVAVIERVSHEAPSTIPPSYRCKETISTTGPVDYRANSTVEEIAKRNETAPVPPTSFRSESDLFFDEIDDAIFDETDIIDSGAKLRAQSGISSRNFDSVENRVEDPLELTENGETSADFEKYSERETMARETTMERKFTPRLNLDVKSSVSATTSLSRLRIDNENRDNAVASTKQTDPAAIAAKKSVEKTTSNKRTAAVLSPPILNSPVEKMPCPRVTSFQKTAKNNRKITDYMKKDDESSSTTRRSNPKICLDSVIDISNASLTDTILRKTVKARVEKFDKLKRNGQLWEVNATIADNTGSIDVLFSSEILESMLGFSVAKFLEVKKLTKKDPEAENYLRQGLRSAENKLLQIDDPLEVELAPNEKPRVVKIKTDNGC